MKKFVCMLAVVILCVSACSVAFADSTTLVEKMSVWELRDFLADEGYRPEVENDETCQFKLNGLTVQVFLYDDGSSVQFHCGWSDTGMTMGDVNRWNSEWRLAKAYLDGDGDPHLELDIDLDGGITMQRLRNFMQNCSFFLDKFVSNMD
ncbi:MULTISPECIES: YbjN domain-containing protein [Dethiosulfovibrio]|uniref:YbjN domain-containing protein n=2 Tax=Dethiosulfovibrio TaxID=47054 RepID=A0ABS9EPM4_9BACT|nr:MULTISPECIES: YbjN domain-containing protein [Dethiosulfovibrio]MCF4114930.1 YbjN domain-containing protein [Dethiosulfovibrio russensis]MCF4142451.1 YbjN domain-containing protein [Dethiosulfovibrio marinus]MCF4145422.1 YbjN domain-containing protein [Dethiosulfovibrio acidaminovorans]